MSVCLDKIYLSVLDSEREILYHVVEAHENDLQHKSVLQASQRMDRIILNWYKQQKIKS